MVTIKRERRKNKFVIVARDNRKRFLTSRRWKKGFHLDDAKRAFKRQGSFHENKFVERHVLAGNQTRQDIILSKPGISLKKAKRLRRPSGDTQAMVTIHYIDPNGAKRKVTAYSNKDTADDEKIDQASERALSRLAEANGRDYDEDVGEQVAKERAIGFRVGWVKFVKV